MLATLPDTIYERIRLALSLAAALALVAAAILTPGFLTVVSISSLLTTTSFIGCVAMGMTFITLSGNIMAFSLGAALGATSIVFMSAQFLGVAGSMLVAVAFCAALVGAQGWIIGFFRANAIIVSLAALAATRGLASAFTGGQGVYSDGDQFDFLKGRWAMIPIPVLVFVASAIIAQTILSTTALGREIIMVGSNRRAARAAGIEPWKPVAAAYLLAGFFVALSAIMMAARYGSGEMEHGDGADYDAISAVLIGGNSIAGGSGSAFRTVLGALGVATVQGLMLTNGFSTESQHLTIGAVVLLAILLQRPES